MLRQKSSAPRKTWTVNETRIHVIMLFRWPFLARIDEGKEAIASKNFFFDSLIPNNYSFKAVPVQAEFRVEKRNTLLGMKGARQWAKMNCASLFPLHDLTPSSNTFHPNEGYRRGKIVTTSQSLFYCKVDLKHTPRMWILIRGEWVYGTVYDVLAGRFSN